MIFYTLQLNKIIKLVWHIQTDWLAYPYSMVSIYKQTGYLFYIG